MTINLNTIYFSKKSSICMSKDGNPLSVYDSYQEALSSANYIGKNLIPYQCEYCNYYHLKPEEFYCEKLTRRCNCVDHNGCKKDTYKTESDAMKIVKIWAKKGKFLRIYKCPQGEGYHLSSHDKKY